MDIRIRQARPLRGMFVVPGDKSISHRALLVAALAEGVSEIEGLSHGADVQSTRQCLQRLGVEVFSSGDVFRVVGRGIRKLSAPQSHLDAGNSGTTLRLLTGILAGQSFPSTITGDASLRRRPMKRIIEPLTLMGGRIESSPEETPPLRIDPVERLKGIEYTLPVASAQVKSALLLAGLHAEGTTTVIEPIQTRDHTERFLGITPSLQGGVRTIAVSGGMRIEPRKFSIPGDISSAAFLLAAAILTPHSEVVVRRVGLNPTRTAYIDVLRQMGARIDVEAKQIVSGEQVGDVRARSSSLSTDITLSGSDISALIDELPILSVVAAFASGRFTVNDARELRYKESDRISTIVSNLRAMGAEVEETEDGYSIVGGANLRGALFHSYGDHRMAMSFAVAALRLPGESVVRQAECADISFPGFWQVIGLMQ